MFNYSSPNPLYHSPKTLSQPLLYSDNFRIPQSQHALPDPQPNFINYMNSSKYSPNSFRRPEPLNEPNIIKPAYISQNYHTSNEYSSFYEDRNPTNIPYFNNPERFIKSDFIPKQLNINELTEPYIPIRERPPIPRNINNKFHMGKEIDYCNSISKPPSQVLRTPLNDKMFINTINTPYSEEPLMNFYQRKFVDNDSFDRKFNNSMNLNSIQTESNLNFSHIDHGNFAISPKSFPQKSSYLFKENDFAYLENFKENLSFPDFITCFGTYKHYDISSKPSKFRKIKNKEPINSYEDDLSYMNFNFEKKDQYFCIFEILKNYIFFDRNIEKLKDELMLQPDFNIYTLFNIFDDNNSGQIVISEWNKGFKNLGMNVDEEDVWLLVNRYGKDRKKTDFDDFCNMILSKSGTNKAFVLNKDRKTNKFLNQTLVSVINLFKMLLNTTFSSEVLRKELSEKKISLKEMFDYIDFKKQKYLTKETLINFLKKYDFYFLSEDILNLLERFDRNLTGKITYEEFEKELIPKINRSK